MDLSMKWLADYVDCDMPIKDFVSALTLSGSKVECFEQEGEDISNVVVGKVVSMERHPDSDHMFITQVDVGEDEPVQIVTGAQNVHEGDFVPVAKHKSSVLHEGKQVKITKGKLRGVASNGMLCSLGELGLSVHDFPYAIEDGIFILGDDCDKTVGKDIHEAIGYNDTTVEFEITSNRPDCLSVIGLARETAATFGTELKVKKPEFKGIDGDINDMLKVKIHNTDLCKRYMAGIVKNVKIGPSPRWMRERLRGCGVRPINNFVDITNYVMLEYGQPMHAFDLRFVDGAKIRIRNAKAGETITTLDGIERKLSEKNLIIADENKPIAIAGVMGGEFSGIVDDTNTIVFESANFDGASVRLTAKEHGMRTDASSRYEKGLDPNNCLPALQRACELVELLDAGDVYDGEIIDFAGESIDKINVRKRIALEPDWINSFLDTKLSVDEMKAILTKLECEFDGEDVLPPTFRPDLQHKADIAEEIARFVGYNTIPSTSISGGAQGKYTARQKFDNKIASTMLALGLSEIMTYSFVSPKYYDKILMPKDSKLRRSVVITNPLGEDTSVMRTSALTSMMEVVRRNWSNRNLEGRFFEIAREYFPTGENQLPVERDVLCYALYGNGEDFFTAKGVAEEVMAKLGLKNVVYTAEKNNPTFHPGRCAKVTVNGELIGYVGQLHPEAAANFGVNAEVYCATLSMEVMFNNAGGDVKYTALPKFPSTYRDLSLVCNEDVPSGDIVAVIEKTAKHLEAVRLFDMYKGEQVPSGMKSLSYKLILRKKDATLTDDEADAVVAKVLKALENIGVTLR